MKKYLVAITIGAFFCFPSCNQKPKTKEDIFKQKMATATDEELMEEFYGVPQNYKVNYVTIKKSIPNFTELNPLGENIREDGVVEVIFNKNKVYIGGFGTMIGTYEKEYYASGDGVISVKFGPYDISDMLLGDRRHSPTEYCREIHITLKYEAINGNSRCNIVKEYFLKTLMPLY